MGHDWIHNADALLPGGSVLKFSAGCRRAAARLPLRLGLFIDRLPRAIYLRMAHPPNAECGCCARPPQNPEWGETMVLARTLALPDWGRCARPHRIADWGMRRRLLNSETGITAFLAKPFRGADFRHGSRGVSCVSFLCGRAAIPQEAGPEGFNPFARKRLDIPMKLWYSCSGNARPSMPRAEAHKLRKADG